jgi:hypothetical protein
MIISAIKIHASSVNISMPMIRAVVAQSPDQSWQCLRQPQWMALIRRDISASKWPRFFIDISEENYQQLIQQLKDSRTIDIDSMNSLLDSLALVKLDHSASSSTMIPEKKST